jgi:uncharacterized protein YuzE
MVQAATELKMSYDRDADVLYCSFGEPQEAISVEADEGIIVRHNPETNEVVGYTVVNFFKRFADRPNKSVSVPLAEAVA